METANYAGNWYGTLKADVGENKVACVDPIGAHSYRDYMGKDLFCVYLDASEEMRKKRMIEKRKDNLLNVEARLTKDKVLFNQSVKDLADVVLDTDPMSVEQCAVAVYDAYLKWKSNRNN